MRRFGSGFLWLAGIAGLSAGIALLLPGCSVGYVTRQSATHLRVLAARQPVDRALAEGDLPPSWLAAIETIQSAKRFGVERLGLPAEDLYETISLVRPGPTWVVTACPRDALRPVTWWFPIAGRVAYRGYYDREDAERFAARLRGKDLDVHLRPASAFSTLGWFADPIRPSMLQGSEAYLVDLVLHEASHSLLYLKGETDFNETFASFVARSGTLLYFQERGCQVDDICARLRDEAADGATFAAFIEDLVKELNHFYARDMPLADKLTGRQAVFEAARRRAGTLPWRRDGYAWFADAQLDNATVLSWRRYGGGQEVFSKLLDSCHGDLGLALQAMVRHFPWRDLPRSRRREITPTSYLQELLDQGPACLGAPSTPDPHAGKDPSPDGRD